MLLPQPKHIYVAFGGWTFDDFTVPDSAFDTREALKSRRRVTFDQRCRVALPNYS
jgi:hypothetical protein